MSGEINVIARTQVILVEPTSASISIINAGPPGPSGTTILSGAGPPSPLLGMVGQYYLDATNHILYGPKAASPPESPLVVAGSITAHTLTQGGVQVQFLTAGVLSHLRYIRDAASSDTLTFQVWDNTSTKLSEVTDTRGSQTGTFDVNLPTPLAIAANAIRRITVSANAGGGIPYNGSTQSVTGTSTLTFLNFCSATFNTFPSTFPPFSFYVSPLYMATATVIWPVAVGP